MAEPRRVEQADEARGEPGPPAETEPGAQRRPAGGRALEPEPGPEAEPEPTPAPGRARGLAERLRPGTGWGWLILMLALFGVALGLLFGWVPRVWAQEGGAADTRALRPGVTRAETAPGGESSPAYRERVRELGRRGAREAERSGRTFVPTAPGGGGSRVQSGDRRRAPVVAPPGRREPAPRPGGVESRQREPAPARRARAARRPRGAEPVGPSDAMLEQMRRLAETLRPQPQTVEVFERAEGERAARAREASGGEAPGRAQARAPEPPVAIAPGTVLYAVNEVALNSDTPGPAVATVTSGPLRGSRLIGGFERRGEHLVLEFSRLALPDGRTAALTAFAVDPREASTAVRTGVDHHRLERWGALFASAFVEGLADAIVRDDSTTTTSVDAGGAVSVVESGGLTAAEQAGIAVGRVGERAGDVLEDRFERPPTVTLAAGAPIGVLVMEVRSPQAPPAGTAAPGVGERAPRRPRARQPEEETRERRREISERRRIADTIFPENTRGGRVLEREFRR